MAQIFASMIRLMRDRGQMYPMYVDLLQSRIFTLFFPSKQRDASVLIYNPGGPGGSGLPQIFENFAPMVLSEQNGRIETTENEGVYSLTNRFHLLYIDIPADTGFSIAKDNGPVQYGDPTTIEDAVRVINAVLKTYRRFVGENPVVDFFGFSYAGKIWPLIAQRLIQNGRRVGGLAIFSGYTDPIRQEIRPLMEYLLYAGFISSTDYTQLERMTDQIEQQIREDPTGKNWRNIQELYMRTIIAAWEAASVDTYDITNPSTVEDPLDKPDITFRHLIRQGNIGEVIDMDILLNDPIVQEALGVNVPYYSNASTFDIETYEGFLASAAGALKFLADRGVVIFYIMGSLDGATLAKGTKDMMEVTFRTRLQERRWIINLENIIPNANRNLILVGKVAQVRPNVYYGTVIGSGHSLESEQGIIAFIAVMDALYKKKPSTIVS